LLKNLSRLTTRLLLLVLVISMILASCGGQASQGPAELVPTLCHSELGVGLLFITIENRGGSIGPSVTSVSFSTDFTKEPRVRLEVTTPSMPAGALRWITVNLPYEPGTRTFLEPAGKVTIVVDASHVSRKTENISNTLVSNCTDAA